MIPPCVGHLDVATRAPDTRYQAHHIREEDEEEDGAHIGEVLAPVVTHEVAGQAHQHVDQHLEDVSDRHALVGHDATARGRELPAHHQAGVITNRTAASTDDWMTAGM